MGIGYCPATWQLDLGELVCASLGWDHAVYKLQSRVGVRRRKCGVVEVVRACCLRNTRKHVVCCSDVQIKLQGLGYFFAHECSNAAAVGPPHKFARNPAICQRMIRRRANWNKRNLLGNQLRHVHWVGKVFDGDLALETRYPCYVCKCIANADLSLAAGSELGPGTFYRSLKIDEPTIDAHQHRNRANSLCSRSNDADRIVVPGRAVYLLPAPQIDDLLAAICGREGRARL